MIYEIKMPSLGADMDKGKLVEWKIKVGDHIIKDQEIAVIETQKAAVELDSFRSGKITELIAQPDQIYPVGAVLAKMDLEEGMLAEFKIAIPENTEKIKELPVEKVLGAVSVDLRESVAKSMSRSKKEIPHYYLKTRVSLDNLIHRLDILNKYRSAEDRIMMPALLLFAISAALKKHPQFNGSYIDGKFLVAENINLGMAISLKMGGVIAPALMRVEKKNLNELNSELHDLIQRARDGKLKAQEISEGTVTVTNVGDLGSHEVYGVIFPPQVALLGLGQIRKEVVVGEIQENGVLVEKIKSSFVIDITLSADHRVTDGLSGSRFLQTLSDLLCVPDDLIKNNPE